MTGVSLLAQTTNRINLFKEQQTLLDSLTTQLTTQKKTQKFTGLDSDVLTVQRARASVKSLEAYTNNITKANRRLELMLKSVEEFQAQANNFLQFLTSFSQESAHQKGEVVYYDDPMTTEVENIPLGTDSTEMDADFTNLTKFAENISDFFVDLLNTKDGDRFLFAGAETLTKPLSKTSTLDSALGGLINSWKDGTITTDDLIADLTDGTTANGNTDAITDTIVGYSSVLSSGSAKNVTMRVDQATELDFTVMANESAFRDIIVAVSYFKNGNLPPIADQVDPETNAVLTNGAPGADMNESKENFFVVFQELTRSITNAVDEIDQVRFRLENTRARIDEIKTFHTNEKNLLLDNISDIEDVDLNEVALSINTLSIQLDASYRVTANVQSLSLVNFL